MERNGAALRRAICDVEAELTPERGADKPRLRPEPKPTALERRRAEAQTQRQATYDEAVRMHKDGASLASIAAALGAAPRTLAWWFAVGHAPLRNRKPGGSILDPFRSHLERRYAQGCRNARLLWRKLRALGFAGRTTIVRTWIGRWNKAQPEAAPTVALPGPR